MDFAARFEQGLTYHAFLDRYASETDKRRWKAMYDQVELTDPQKELLRGFVREMNVLVVAGAWCGDCINQCPIFARIEAENERIRIRYFDRDQDADLARELSICGAPRVPSVLFLSEDGYPCGRAGDRTLSKYRDMAATLGGAGCPSGIALPDDPLVNRVVQDWLDEFERIQLMLRTSSRLRQKHGD